MPKFLILYTALDSASERMANSTQEEMQKSMAEWMSWKEQAEKSVMFEWGMPLEARDTLTASGIEDSTSLVSGYSIMESDSKDKIIEQLQSHPHLRGKGTSIEVLEMLSMPGM